MADEFVRRSFTRYRLGGVAALTIPSAWLRVLGPLGGAPQILDPIAQVNRTLAAEIRIKAAFDVRVGDILKDSTGRIFIVGQIQPEADANLCHCPEIRAPIPDEFNAQSIEAFWTQTTSGFSISSDGPSESVLLLSSMPAGTLPSGAKGNYQLVSGDFDVWAKLRTDAGSSGNVRNALLGARHPSSALGCYIGVRDDGATGDLVRLDEYATSTLDTTVGVGSTSAALRYVRLKRTGSRFQAFYRILSADPVTESDWIEIVNDAATSFSSTDDLRIGLWGYTNNSTQGQALFAFMRNWSGSGSASSSAVFSAPLDVEAVVKTTANLAPSAGEFLIRVDLPSGLLSFTTGVTSIAEDVNTGASTYIAALYGTGASFSSANVSQLVSLGVDLIVDKPSGTITHAILLDVNRFPIYFGGAITNLYGLLIHSLAAFTASNKWAIKTSGPELVELGGRCVIGTAGSRAASEISLQVSSPASPTAQVAQFRNNTTPVWELWPAPWQVQAEATTDPTTTQLVDSNHFALYRKNNKLVIAVNLSGTINYLSIDLDGSDTSWSWSTSAP